MSLVRTLMNGGINEAYIDTYKYDHESGPARVAIESTEELHDIFMSSYIYEQAEIASVREGVELWGSRFEIVAESAVSDGINKIKEFFQKLWAKIKAIIKSIIMHVTAIFMKAKDFVKKYKKEISDASGKLNDFEFKMFKYDDARINNMEGMDSFDVEAYGQKMIEKIAGFIGDTSNFTKGHVSESYYEYLLEADKEPTFKSITRDVGGKRYSQIGDRDPLDTGNAGKPKYNHGGNQGTDDPGQGRRKMIGGEAGYKTGDDINHAYTVGAKATDDNRRNLERKRIGGEAGYKTGDDINHAYTVGTKATDDNRRNLERKRIGGEAGYKTGDEQLSGLPAVISSPKPINSPKSIAEMLTASKDLTDEDKMAARVANDLKFKATTKDEFTEGCYAAFRGGATGKNDKESVSINSLDPFVSAIENSKPDNLKKYSSKVDTAYSKIVKSVDSAANKLDKTEKEGLSDQAKTDLANSVEILRNCSKGISLYQSYHNTYLKAWKTVIAERDNTYKSLLLAGISNANKKKKEK